MARKKPAAADRSTEDRIRDAARKVFTRKGYAATRTRDIAEEAGINLALLNYYFRSKEKLFGEVMLEKVQQFFGVLLPVLKDPSTELDVKIALIVSNYVDILIKNPNLPLFVLSELRGHTDKLLKVLPVDKIIPDTSFVKQLQERRPDINPVHFLMNILGMTVFPFIAMPVFDMLGIMKKKDFEAVIKERKQLIPLWTDAMLKAK